MDDRHELSVHSPSSLYAVVTDIGPQVWKISRQVRRFVATVRGAARGRASHFPSQ